MAATIDESTNQAISFNPLPVGSSLHETSHIAPSNQVDQFGKIHQSFLTSIMDCIGGLSVYEYLQTPDQYIVPTRSFDLLHFYQSIEPHTVVQFQAKTTRVWNSSIEIKLQARKLNDYNGEKELVGEAYVTYAAMKGPRNAQGKIQLPPCYTENEQEQLDFELADIRREKRIQFELDRKTIRELMHEVDNVEKSFGYNNTTNILFPVHMNPFKITFGGQIMDWIGESAKLSAIKATQSSLVSLKTIKSLQFLLPSTNGEVLFTRSLVSGINVQDRTIEIYTAMFKRSRENPNLTMISDSFSLFEILQTQTTLEAIQPQSNLQQLLFSNFENRWN